MAIDGFIDYITQKTLEIAKDPDLDFKIASAEVRFIANFDREALRLAQSRMGMRLFDDPDDQMARRTHKLLRMALESYPMESQRG